GAPPTGVVRQWSKPAASRAAATVSPARASTGLPSMVSETVLAPVSGSLANIEPPRAEGADQGRIEPALGDHGRERQCMVGGERHAGVAADDECAGAGGGLV